MDITVAEIERDLRELWKDMARKAQKGDAYAVTRACVFNLVVYAPGERSDQEISQITSEVTGLNPGRIIVLLPESASGEARLSAWVNAQCHVSAGRRTQVCCEEVMIRSGGAVLDRLSSFVMPLLLPDLPVFLWWRDDLNVDTPLFQELSEVSDRIVFDSSRMTPESLRSMFRFIRENQAWTAFSDLSWSRLTPWRLAIAQLYDVPSWRSALATLNRVELHLAGQSLPEFSQFVRPAFVLAWLGSRLSWHPRSAATKSRVSEYSWEFETPQTQLTVRISSTDSPQALDLISIKLIAEGGNLQFVISKSDDGSRLNTEVTAAGTTRVSGVTRLDSGQEANLIGKELEILGHDRVFEKTLELAEAFLVQISSK